MSDTPNEKSRIRRKWRLDFASLMRRERELSGFTTTEDCPKGGDYQEQIETAVRIPELSYLLRFMMWLDNKGKPLPTQSRLRKLLILWCLARIESLIETDDFKFKDQAVTDYEAVPKPEAGDKKAQEEYKEKINRLFQQKWKKSALKAQGYFEEKLYPVYEDMPEARERVQGAATRLPTLESFPEAFNPLVVVVGGYGGPVHREPEHVSELFRQSQSFVNLHYLLSLNLRPDTEIVSDRLLLELNDDPERAAALLGHKHILVIGSPLVNAFSRHLILNKKLVFNFVFRRETYELGKDFYDNMIKSRLLETPPALSMFYRLMDTPPDEIDIRSSDYKGVEPAHRQEIADMVFRIRELAGNPQATNEQVTNQFRPREMFSPFDPQLHIPIGDTHHEFAVISLAENYWAEQLRKKDEPPEFAAIVVAGMNELSTTLAVKVLSRKGDFKGRPLGGLLDITGGKSSGLKRITGAGDKWITHPYQARDVLKKIDLVSQTFKERPSAFHLFETPRELELYREIVEDYA